MHIEVELPELGPHAGDQAMVSEWFYDEGEEVEAGSDLLEIVAEGITRIVSSPASGVLLARLVEEDDIVCVGDPLAIIEIEEDEEYMEEEEE